MHAIVRFTHENTSDLHGAGFALPTVEESAFMDFGVKGTVKRSDGTTVEVRVSHVTAFSAFIETETQLAFAERVYVRFHDFHFEGQVAFVSELPRGVVVVAEEIAKRRRSSAPPAPPPDFELLVDPPIPLPRQTMLTGEHRALTNTPFDREPS